MGGGVRVGQQGQGYETLLSIYLKILLMLILFLSEFFWGLITSWLINAIYKVSYLFHIFGSYI